MELIRDKVRQVSGREIDVELRTRPSGAPEAETPAPTPRAQAPQPRARVREAEKAGVRLNPRNTFENFIVGPSNQLAHAAAMAVAQSPGKSYNPLFLYGETGLGKTHLMQAIAHSILQNGGTPRVVYVSCETFTNEFCAAVRENTLDQFRKYYRTVDVLLIDDVQFLEGKERTQDEFFHTFNDLFDSQKQLCLSSDRRQRNLRLEAPRLALPVGHGDGHPAADSKPARRSSPRRPRPTSTASARKSSNSSPSASRAMCGRMEGALLKVATYGQLVKGPSTSPPSSTSCRTSCRRRRKTRSPSRRSSARSSSTYDLR
jgi:chromosomal replication initiator protein